MRTRNSFPPIETLRGRVLGRILIKMGLLTREKVYECLAIQRKKPPNVKIGEIFLELGLVNKQQLRFALAAQKGKK